MKMNLQLFGGNGSASHVSGGGGPRASGPFGPERDARMRQTLINEGLSEKEADKYIANENEAANIQIELSRRIAEGDDMSTGHIREQNARVDRLRRENASIRWGGAGVDRMSPAERQRLVDSAKAVVNSGGSLTQKQWDYVREAVRLGAVY